MSDLTTYDLHKLGWRAFQDLCAVILQQVLDQTFHTFADSNDGGRDGAFYGQWRNKSQSASLPNEFLESLAVVAQCKFSAVASGTLPPSALADELSKVERLQLTGACDAYLLLTNLRVTGNTETWLRQELSVRGVANAMVLDGNWICQQISTNPILRRHVPRVYGLGDLGQILDDRRLQQAKALMSRLQEDLATFVPTSAYRQAADALAHYGFTLLLGAPAAGKSTIAATLSMAALDEWGSSVIRVDSAAELVASWNPIEPDQLFWIDDAFGAIRHDHQLTDQWSRRLDQVMTAVRNGAKVILTSRDYIYRAARTHLKEYAYPLLREQAVVVDVAALTDSEKRRILYNHLKAGDQPSSVLQKWRSALPAIAASENFQPEVARRLGLAAFTVGIKDKGSFGLRNYVDRPVEFLRDVLSQLDTGSHAALACVYLSGDGLEIPLVITPSLEEAIDRMGASRGSVGSAFTSLEGTFLMRSANVDGSSEWRFRHPTIREGFAAMIAADPNALCIVLDGLNDEELLHQIDCGSDESGTLIQVPPALYESIARRMPLMTGRSEDHFYSPLGSFLRNRCSDEFLRIWARLHTQELSSLLNFGTFVDAFWQPPVLGRLQSAGALPSELRIEARDILEKSAIESFDSGWLDSDVVCVFTDEERRKFLERVRQEQLQDIESTIDYYSDGYSSGTAEERYRPLIESFTAYIDAFEGNTILIKQMNEALATIESRISDDSDDASPSRESFSPTTYSDAPSIRDEFDDVELGRD